LATVPGLAIFLCDEAFDQPELEPFCPLDGDRPLFDFGARMPQEMLAGHWDGDDFERALDAADDA
jgi:hypothetical protein